eukprot:TRINITY_DN75838_c0_g1_i1.p1 TRINITY_DN75838_c0_g1~~TRINITY_DN75838_c0_g1_i1.p1  ORF type:complete len:304 (-),score=54.49 TRINITY_DN75838_c0_g1_i1:5-883(-)
MGASSNSKAAVAEYFNGKVVWITGASAGLGEALCLALCEQACPKAVIVSARTEAKLEKVRARCQQLRPGVDVLVLPLDLADLSSLQPAAKAALARYGRVDVLINNGGVGFRGLCETTPLAQDQYVMNVDFFSGVALVKALLPGWLSGCPGHVVQISSVQGFFGLPGRTAYSAAKHAAIGFYDSLRAEVSDAGVSVTVVGPGYIKTGHSENAVVGGARYPEGHTAKGVPPEDLARDILLAAAQKRPELVPAALDARVARQLRNCFPPLLFWVMRRRARKERLQMSATGAAALS